MPHDDATKATLLRYLRTRRADLLGKLDGLGEYDVRRPMTSTGTNLLGLVKHVATCELEYFTVVFGRESGWHMPWAADGAEDDADLWATAVESRESVLALHHHSAARSDATITELALDAPGVVPWWRPSSRDVTLHTILVHMISETARHAGHADILRETLDGTVGHTPDRDADGWAAHRARLEAAAREAAGRHGA